MKAQTEPTITYYAGRGYHSHTRACTVRGEPKWVHGWATAIMPGISFEYYDTAEEAHAAQARFVERYSLTLQEEN